MSAAEGLDVYLSGADELQRRLLPGLRALCEHALANQAPTERAYSARIRAINARCLEIRLEQGRCFSVLRDILAVQTWYELECRGEDYKPRGVVDVTHVWAIWEIEA